MVLKNPNEESIYKDYIKKNAKKSIKHLIDEGNVAVIVQILSLGFVNAKNIDEFVMYANEKKQVEIQIKLMNYKNEHIGYKEINLKI